MKRKSLTPEEARAAVAADTRRYSARMRSNGMVNVQAWLTSDGACALNEVMALTEFKGRNKGYVISKALRNLLNNLS